MGDLLGNDTEVEDSKYYEAQLAFEAGVNPAIEKNKKSVFNADTGKHEILLPMSGGGYIKIGEEGGKVDPPPSVLIEGMEFGPETPEFQRYYPAPQVMDEAPIQPETPSMEVDPMQVEGAQRYAEDLQAQTGSYSMEDLEAAGYGADVVKAAGLVSPVEPMSQEEIAKTVSEGGSLIGPYDPTIREDGVAILREYSIEAAEEQLREELAAAGADPRTIELEVQAAMPSIRSEADILSNAVFGTGNPLGIGAADFVTMGVMDIQEGSRMFQQNRGPDGSVAGRAVGTLLVLAGVAEATGVGLVAGKLIKKAAMKLQGPMGKTAAKAGFENDLPAEVAEVRAPTEERSGIIAFHGSGADFERFEIGKIGTGEKAQAFGHGLYFTDSEDIAEFYRKSVRGRQDLSLGYEVSYKGNKVSDLGDTPLGEAQPYENSAINKIADNISKVTTMATKDLPQSELVQLAKDRAIKVLQGEIKRTAETTSGSMFDELADLIGSSLDDELKALQAIDPNDVSFAEGKKYQVRLDVSPQELLNWDLPLDKQTPEAQRAILKTVDELTMDDAINLGVDVFDAPYNGDEKAALSAAKEILLKDFSANRFLNTWSAIRGSDGAGEQLLAKNGLKGIKYKADQGPGVREGSAGGPDNYVIFDDKLIQIMKKYGIVGPVSVTALTSKGENTEGADNGI